MEVTVTVVGQAGTVSGSPSDHVLTFSGPIQIPGVSLTPGAYCFRKIAPTLLQVSNEDRTTIYATFFVHQVWKDEPTKDYTVKLEKTVAAAPPRLTTLFPAHSLEGYSIPYPKGGSRSVPPSN
jgi:hypothetical protein